jgi:hypothetical protein
MPLQLVVPEHVIVQAPLPHAVPPMHTVPGAPQLFESLERLTQAVTGPSLLYVVAGT